MLEHTFPPRCWNTLVKRMPIPCVDTIVHRRGEVLLGWRTIQPYKNVWALIGGRMRYGETFSDTSIRNCQESGLMIQQPKYLGIFPIRFLHGRHELSICIVARHVKGEPKPTRELAKYIWVKENELAKMHPIGANYLKMLNLWRRKRSSRALRFGVRIPKPKEKVFFLFV